MRVARREPASQGSTVLATCTCNSAHRVRLVSPSKAQLASPVSVIHQTKHLAVSAESERIAWPNKLCLNAGFFGLCFQGKLRETAHPSQSSFLGPRRFTSCAGLSILIPIVAQAALRDPMWHCGGPEDSGGRTRANPAGNAQWNDRGYTNCF